ncbi:MAG: carbamate kinase [Burkholderiales bacterium]
MRLVVAIGGNALLRRGQALSAENQIENIRIACSQLARVANSNELVLTHGNGPQVGMLALQTAAYEDIDSYSLDVLGAETDGMLGYLIEQELSNALAASRHVATLLTRVEVDRDDLAFKRPTKPIGPVYTKSDAQRIAAARHWDIAADGTGFRRVVASPRPLRVLGLDPIRWLLERGAVVIAAGGGGIPVAKDVDGRSLAGVDAVIDKDLCSGLLARGIQADCLVIVTDVKAVFLGWGTPGQRAVGKVTPQALARHSFPAGSMGPKVEAACEFVRATGKRAVIGSLDQIEAMLACTAGTQVCRDGADSV